MQVHIKTDLSPCTKVHGPQIFCRFEGNLQKKKSPRELICNQMKENLSLSTCLLAGRDFSLWYFSIKSKLEADFNFTTQISVSITSICPFYSNWVHLALGKTSEVVVFLFIDRPGTVYTY